MGKKGQKLARDWESWGLLAPHPPSALLQLDTRVMSTQLLNLTTHLAVVCVGSFEKLISK